MAVAATICLTGFPGGSVVNGQISSEISSETDRQRPSRSKSILINDAQLSLIQNTEIASPLEGMVESVKVIEGDRVGRGQPMVQLNNDQVTSELKAASAAYEAAQLEAANDVDVRYARQALQIRQRELQQNLEANQNFAGAVSESEIEKLKLIVNESELAIEQAMHDLEVAAAVAREQSAATEIVQARLEKHTVTSPIDSRVVEVLVQLGQWVEPGQPVVRLISLNPIRVECFVDGQKYGDELVGSRVEFSVNGQTSRVLRGIVEFVSPEIHPVTGQARLRATLKNPNEVARAGMRGTLVIYPE